MRGYSSVGRADSSKEFGQRFESVCFQRRVVIVHRACCFAGLLAQQNSRPFPIPYGDGEGLGWCVAPAQGSPQSLFDLGLQLRGQSTVLITQGSIVQFIPGLKEIMTSNLDILTSPLAELTVQDYNNLVQVSFSSQEAWTAVPLISLHLPVVSSGFVFSRSVWAVSAAVVIFLLTFFTRQTSYQHNGFLSSTLKSVQQFWNNSVLERVNYKWRDVSRRSFAVRNPVFRTDVTVSKPQGFFSLSKIQRKTTGVWVTVLFFVLLFSNQFGLVPLCTQVTGQAGTTLGLSIQLLLQITLAGMERLKVRFVKLFLPSGPSWPMAPLFILLESISYSFRAISLGVRLWRNLLSGHMLLHLFQRFSLIPFFCTNRIIQAPITRLAQGLLMALTGLETMVQVLQSGVFGLLASFYLTEVLSKQDTF